MLQSTYQQLAVQIVRLRGNIYLNHKQNIITERTEIMWAYNETFYQIYPIGFCGAPTHNDGVTMHRILKLQTGPDISKSSGSDRSF